MATPFGGYQWWEPDYKGPLVTNAQVDAFPEPPADWQPAIRHEPDDRTANTIIIASDQGMEIAGAIIGEHREPNEQERLRLRRALWAAINGLSPTKH